MTAICPGARIAVESDVLGLAMTRIVLELAMMLRTSDLHLPAGICICICICRLAFALAVLQDVLVLAMTLGPMSWSSQ